MSPSCGCGDAARAVSLPRSAISRRRPCRRQRRARGRIGLGRHPGDAGGLPDPLCHQRSESAGTWTVVGFCSALAIGGSSARFQMPQPDACDWEWRNDGRDRLPRSRAMTEVRLPAAVALAATLGLAGCASTYPLMPTPTLYTWAQARPLFTPGADRGSDIRAGSAVHYRPRARDKPRSARTVHGREVAPYGIRVNYDPVRRRNDVGCAGKAEPARPAPVPDESQARSDEGARALPAHSLRSCGDTRGGDARSRCRRCARDGQPDAAGRDRETLGFEPAQGDGAVRPRRQELLHRRGLHDG